MKLKFEVEVRNLKLKKFEVEYIWSWINLKWKKSEVEEIWSWRNLKSKKFEVEVIWSWRNLKLRKFEVEEIQSWRNFWGRVRLNFFWPTYVNNQLCFWKSSPIVLFYLAIFETSFVIFWALQGFFFLLFGAIFGSRSGSKTFLEPTYVDNCLWYSQIFLFLIRPNLGPFCTFWALRGYFWG